MLRTYYYSTCDFNIIISGLAVLGIRSDNRCLDVEDYTPKYSAIIKLAWLIVV